MGVPVRVHVLLLLFIALIFGIEWYYQHNYDRDLMGTGLVTTLVLIVSVLFHELAHVFAVTNLGGHVNNIVLAPWGGNSDLALPATNRGRAIVYLAGPFISAVIFLLGAMLLTQTGNGSWEELTNPFRPHEFRAKSGGVALLKIATWLNFQLFLVNLIPCFPFDGSGVLRSIVAAINPALPKVRTEATIMVIGNAVGLAMIGMAWLLYDYNPGPVRPVWLMFLVAGLSLIFSSRYSYARQVGTEDDAWDELDDLEYESLYDEPAYFDFSDDDHSAYSQWLSEKHEARQLEERELEKKEERLADEILKKLHRDGVESLSEEERSLLQRVSARLRRRREQGV
jgi:Zn-dependent protease